MKFVREKLLAECKKLVTVQDSPEAIARGVGIGIFFGFMPLFGLKTLLSLLLAFPLRANKIATVIAVTLHDIALPFMPVVFRIEYYIGYWLLSHPHRLPPSLSALNLDAHSLLSCTTFLHVGGPLLLGACVFSLPFALLAFFLTRGVLSRRRSGSQL